VKNSMKMRTLAAVLALGTGALAACTGAQAQAQPSTALAGVCPAAATPVEAVACLDAEHRIRDARLNAVYERMMLGGSPEVRRDLRHRQRAWIRAKEAVCASAVADAGSGPETGVVAARCYLEQTTQRLAYLERLAAELR
jgi:uncharacterized protein YecT (DUF1311 family)